MGSRGGAARNVWPPPYPRQRRHRPLQVINTTNLVFDFPIDEQGEPVTRWGRLIFYVADVDACWAYLREKGFHPESPQDASWGERYFQMSDPDGHELSFARPLE
jgi:uncharacterized glyoxalase superfamily protein PhnB